MGGNRSRSRSQLRPRSLPRSLTKPTCSPVRPRTPPKSFAAPSISQRTSLRSSPALSLSFPPASLPSSLSTCLLSMSRGGKLPTIIGGVFLGPFFVSRPSLSLARLPVRHHLLALHSLSPRVDRFGMRRCCLWDLRVRRSLASRIRGRVRLPSCLSSSSDPQH